MCYQLVLVSPLTVSEVRSMLPPGVRADIVDAPVLARWRTALRGAHAAVHLRVGRCACRLLPARLAPAPDDEAALRAEHRRRRTPREQILAALERHRAGAADAELVPPGALAALIAEHARNAGPAVYALGFGAPGEVPPPAATLREVPLAEACAGEGWLVEDTALKVRR
jgi:hypothetical protein